MSLAWLVWGLGAALYFIGFYHRVAPAVLTSELSGTFHLTAAGLGNLSAFYFYSYVAMQIPTGLLADRYGPRILLTLGGVVAALGTVAFASADSATAANLGRLLIGASVGVAFVGMLKLSSRWMPARQFALTSGVALAVGVFGAVVAGAPLRLMVNEFGWRAVMWASAAVTLAVAAVSWWLVRDDPGERHYRSHAPADAMQGARIGALAGLKAVLGYRNVVLIYFLAGSMPGIVLTFAGLWGVPFLTTHYGLSQTGAAGLCSTMMVAWALGSLTFGALSDRLRRRKWPMVIGMCVASVAWAAIIFVPGYSVATLTALLIVCGFSAGCFIINFAYAKDSVPITLAGTVSGVANMGVIQGPMFMQPLVGLVLDHSWQGATTNGKRIFAFDAYTDGFAVILGWAVLSIGLALFTRETHGGESAKPPPASPVADN